MRKEFTGVGTALIDVGLYSPEMVTEDIDITWKLQRRFYDVRFEPRAVVWMQVPATYAGLFRQRLRWARGLAQVLRRHLVSTITAWRHRRFWPVLVESMLSIAWAYCAAALTALWIASRLTGASLLGVFGVLALILAGAQFVFGVFGAARGDARWMAVVRPAVAGQFVLVSTAMAALLHAFITFDLRRGQAARALGVRVLGC